MAALDETKARLLRGAVQDNIGVVQGVRVKRVTRQTRRLKFWLSGSLVATWWPAGCLDDEAVIAVDRQDVT